MAENTYDVIVIGIGPVGYTAPLGPARLGSSVTLLAQADGLLPRMEPFAGELAGQVPISRLWHAVPCFPSISEVWLHLLEAYQA